MYVLSRKTASYVSVDTVLCNRTNLTRTLRTAENQRKEGTILTLRKRKEATLYIEQVQLISGRILIYKK